MEYHIEQLEEIMYFYKALKEKYINELANLPSGHLICSKAANKYHFYQAEKKNDAYQRRGITKRNDIIRALSRKEYVRRSLKVIDTNIKSMERALNDFTALTPQNIIGQMNKAYKLLPEQYFFSQNDNSAAISAANETASNKINKWLNAAFPQSSYKPEEKRHITSRGLRVRSKSELLIAEKLYEFEIPFRYEQLLYIGEKTLAPDFTVNCSAYSPNNTLKYWEHCGLTGSPQYMYRHKKKLELYERSGIVPWKNLIVTYDDELGNIDLSVIESEIRNKILCQRQ